jgi:hypothetical protein
VGQTPDSLGAQIKNLNELTESLSSYLKLFCEDSKKGVETELSQVKLDYAERIEVLNVKLQELKLKGSDHEKEAADWL